MIYKMQNVANLIDKIKYIQTENQEKEYIKSYMEIIKLDMYLIFLYRKCYRF